MGMWQNFKLISLKMSFFIAFETSKMATFHHIPVYYKQLVFCFYTLFYASKVFQGSFFDLRTIVQPTNMYREVERPKAQN